jgi:rhomboid family GlyGly-CTERM serine protease
LKAAAQAAPAHAQGLHQPSRVWWALTAALALGALAAAGLDATRIDWQPQLAFSEPWRWWSAAWVHWSAGHRWANVAGALLVAAFGWRAGCDRADAWAWFAAWPLTHLALLMQPALLHYGGLSGVLHAGVVIAAVALLRAPGRRWLGAAVLAGTTVKLLLEQPWAAPLQPRPGWDIAIAPWAHLGGAIAGLACALAASAWRRHARPSVHGHREG